MQCVMACNFKFDSTMGIEKKKTHIEIIPDFQNLTAKAKLCLKCQLCIETCPQNAITVDREGIFRIDYDICDGCKLCLDVCPAEVIIEYNNRPLRCNDCLECVKACEPAALQYC